MTKLKLFMITCNESQFILPTTCYLINKYSDEFEINILDYKKPEYELGENVNFISMGENRNIDNWFSDIYLKLSEIDDEYIIFTVDDMPLIDYLDGKVLDFVKEYLDKNKDIACFYGGDSGAKGNTFYSGDKYELWDVKQRYHHKTNCQMNIWKREALMEIFKSKANNLTHFEQQGINNIRRSKFKNYKFIGLSVKGYKGYKSFLFPLHRWTLCSSRYLKDNIISKNWNPNNMHIGYNLPDLEDYFRDIY